MDRRQFVKQYDRVQSLEECERSCAGLANYFGIRLRHVEETIDRSRPWIKPTAQLQNLTTTFAEGYQRLLDNRWTSAVLDEGFKSLLRIIARTATLPDGSLDPLATIVKWLPAGAAYKLSMFLAEKQSKWKQNNKEAATCKELMDEFWRESLLFRRELYRLKGQFSRDVWR